MQLANGIREHGLVEKKLVACVPTRPLEKIRSKLTYEVALMKRNKYQVVGLIGQAITEHKEKVKNYIIPAKIEKLNEEVIKMKEEFLSN